MTLGRDDDAAREALWMPYPEKNGKPRRGARWWGESAFARWLAGEIPQSEEAREGLTLQRRRQVRVSIDPASNTVSDGALFSHDVVETLERDAEWAFGVETNCRIAADQVATLGSDRRLAYVESLDDALFAMPMALRQASANGSRGLRLVLVTPACFEHGWLPDGFAPNGEQYRGRLHGLEAELILRSALVDRPIAVSGWDMVAGQPKQTARMVPAGAVYFFERADESAFTAAHIEALWLSPVGGRTNEGFGRVVPALWNPQQNGA
uniref:Putative CRISPR-associated protein Crm3 n=1 Tax=mine drainage metagenome TaxID=410659 RepID=E6Q6Q7_9ZZZZ